MCVVQSGSGPLQLRDAVAKGC